MPPIVDRSWYYPVRRLEGMDGRFMNVHCSPDSGCQYENDDGLLYAYLSDDAIHALQRHTVAAQLTALADDGEGGRARAKAPLPFVLRYEWDPAHVELLSGDSKLGSHYGAHTCGSCSRKRRRVWF